MLSVSGIIAIVDEPQEKTFNGGAYFNFTAIAADPSVQDKRHTYKASMFVPEKALETAREQLQSKKVIQIHHGWWQTSELTDDKTGKQFTVNNLKISWTSCTVLGWFNNRKK